MPKTFKNRPRVPGPGRCSPRVRKTRKGTCLPPKIKKGIRNINECGNDEKCMIEKSSLPEKMKQELLQTYFRPDMPNAWKEDPDMWLTNQDIDNVLKQYEESNPDFHFLGVVPIDFSAPDIYSDKKKCLHQIFCTINLKEERERGIRIIGAVFNLDHHLKGGSHWVSCAIDLKRRKIYYFDSNGMETPPQIARFMKSFILQDSSLTLEQNKRRFQYGDTECGMYSTYFLIRMIEGDSFKSFVRRPILDKEMIALRKKLFYERA